MGSNDVTPVDVDERSICLFEAHAQRSQISSQKIRFVP
jgi:hypothetical protein